MRFLVMKALLALALLVTVVDCNSRVKRQVSIGFGLPPAGNQNVGDVLNGFLGGFFGNNNPNFNPNFNRPNHNHHNHNQPTTQPNFINPFTILNQFAGGFNQNQACAVENGGCQQGCRMRRRRLQCFCHPGFVLNNDQVSCSDIDECTLGGQSPCQGLCTNTEGSFQCSCSGNAVLLQDARSCGQEAATCADNNGGCEQVCRENKRRGTFCRCRKGYELGPDERSCIDIDECASGTHTCDATQVCANTLGKFQCNIAGAESCDINNGGCQQRCIHNNKGIRCACRKAFALRDDGTSCSRLPQNPNSNPNQRCSENNGGCEHRCRNRRRRRICSCRRGFELQSDGVSCLDPGNGAVEQSCSISNGGCQHRCRETGGGPKCACRKKFELQADGKSCIKPSALVSQNPCDQNNGGCDQICINNNGVVQCDCKPGFVFGNGFCQPLDPCQTNNGGCEHVCVNNNGNAVCECNVGFILANGVCQLIDPCQTNNGGCEQLCVNDKGNVVCECNLGFVLLPNGVCEKPDPCLTNNGGCDQLCVNNNGNAVCQCNVGFVLSGGFCIPTDPCQANNGGCDQVCVNNGGTVKCECHSGFIFANGFCQHQIQIGPPVQNTTPKPAPGCGVNTKKSLLRRIVGGKPADPKDWPWMAAILRVAGDQQFCGGALITDRHILTAAHCIISFRKEDIKVRLGEYNFDTPDENNPTDFRVDDIRMHKSYDPQNQENDIAILKMGRPSSFSEFIWPVCLPPPNTDFQDQLGYVTGWGTIDFGGPVSSVLQEVIIPVWNQTACVAAYPENKVANTMMCAGLRAGGKDSCQGDSGGPFLVQIFPDTRWFLAGVVSWGIECASPNRPGVYTRVNRYLDWIKDNSIF